MPSLCRSALLSLLAAALPLGAHATLGGAASSVDADVAQLNGARSITQAGAWNVHEITLASGTVLREFVAQDTQKVFAVAWQGPFLPDLKQVLGEHFDEMVKASSGANAGRSSLSVQTPGLVVHSVGRMRAYSGQAWLPGQMPQGARVEDIR
ncbi:DUF2844 domain-containing protein [Variovorax sp. J22R133]|uniref:DUF2844 domain-containing protein n=1 Tax=Variovorax brevis TaxID=3053503 RepID=UPI00257536E0|nr:DUF2844 domain-containing protein [Variovorax sp. J22R133]MDM0113669.1 DUF2844 domain-containing protein [Variovorax sp. J22R133]